MDILLLITFFAVKHFVFDWLLQTPYEIAHKGIYGHLGGITHSAKHSFGSVMVMLAFGVDLNLTLMLAFAEFLAHYHIDWAKQQLVKRLSLTHENRAFWWFIGGDQLLHQLTYVAMAFAIMPS